MTVRLRENHRVETEPYPGERRSPEAALVFLPECLLLSLHSEHLRRRGFRIGTSPSPQCDVLVFCADHLGRYESEVVGLHVPKLVLGADPPALWRRAERLDSPLLPLDLERRIVRLLRKPDQPAGDRFRLLIVEDDATVRAATEAAFAESGFEVRSVGGFASVQEEMRRRPDFILMDLQLPGLSGEALGEILRRQGVPIAVYSSEPPERLEAARARIGAVAAFSKGMALHEVAARVRRHLEGAKA